MSGQKRPFQDEQDMYLMAEMQGGKVSTFEDQDAELRPVWWNAALILGILALALIAWKGW